MKNYNMRNLLQELSIDMKVLNNKKRGTIEGLFSEEVQMIELLMAEGRSEDMKKILQAKSREEFVSLIYELGVDLESANVLARTFYYSPSIVRSLILSSVEDEEIYDSALDILMEAKKQDMTIDNGINSGSLSKLLEMYAKSNDFSKDEDKIDAIWIKMLSMSNSFLAI